MKLVSNTYWRLSPPPGTDPAAIVESRQLTHPPELITKVKKFDGIVVGSWDPGNEHGRVHALGIVHQVDGRSAVIDWRRVDFTLRPTAQGATQWRRRPVFRFAGPVAERYKLMERFQDAFASHAGTSGTPQSTSADRPALITPVPKVQEAEPQTPPAKAAQSVSPQCNRVAPNGVVFASPERGLFMGNRTSPPRWLVCDLHFKRDLKEPRKYTKLFFLDEAVALAAGHRPCNTCRRDRFQAYLAAANSELALQGATDLDRKLDAARKAPRPKFPIDSLPDGTFIELGDEDFRLIWSGELHRWTPGGYVDSSPLEGLQIGNVSVLTPEPALAALRNGYSPVVHTSVT